MMMNRACRWLLASEVGAAHRLGHAGRALLPLDLDRLPRGHLDRPVADLLDRQQLRAQPDALADAHGGGEADLVQAVVDAHPAAQVDLDSAATLAQLGDQRERQVAVGDRPAEEGPPGALGVDVDVLVVAGGVGEGVDALLGDLQPLAHAELLADQLLQLGDAGDDALGARLYVAHAPSSPLLLPSPDTA